MQHRRRTIFIITLLLLMFGVVMMYSSSAIYAYEEFQDSMFFLKKHLCFMLIGFVAMFYIMSINIARIEEYSRIIMVLSALTLLLVLVPGVGVIAGGARRWFRLLGGLSFQPSEFAKFALILYLADYLQRKGCAIKDLRLGYLPAVFVISLMCGLVLIQPDLGTAISIFFVGFLIVFIAGGELKHIFSTVLLGLPFLYYLIFSVPYRRRRMLIFLDPWQDKSGAGFQIIQSLVAIGSGGLLGVGLGHSKQKLFYLPEAHTDFVFSIIGEELGLIGGACIIALFAMFVWQGMKAFFKEHRTFNKILIFGITNMIGLEAVINIGVCTGFFPTKGLPLPFISYGGSSLTFHMAAVGLMLNAMRE
ncbi:MAG: putative lipid II flippase FtsW [Candidatus Omnitrophota bacterium]